MSLAEKLIEQGVQKGKLEGLREGEINLIVKILNNGVEPAFIVKNTGFPLQKIKEMQDKNKN